MIGLYYHDLYKQWRSCLENTSKKRDPAMTRQSLVAWQAEAVCTVQSLEAVIGNAHSTISSFEE